MRLFFNKALLDTARDFYAEPHRGYHGPAHFDELIALARLYTPDLGEAEQLALLFHDAVYVPGAAPGENELQSALLMRSCAAKLGVVGVDLDRAQRIVQATSHAEPPPLEAARVCDLDLWRLAAPWEQFQQHALGIRHEYLPLHADEAAFWKARNGFYAAMLEKPHIFATDYFRKNFEAIARTNMKRAFEGPSP